jgi:transcriptional regulator with XRE-family HTH domain
MNEVSKNIKRLRKRDNISQEILAEKLNITRQAVSNWENGRTQPDVDMLMLIAAVFSTDINEVIYGENRLSDTYPNNKRKRIIAAAVYAFLFLLFLAFDLFLKPYLSHMTRFHYERGLTYMFYMYTGRQLLHFCASILFLSIFSLWKDIRIHSTLLRNAFLAVGVALLIYYILFLSGMFLPPLPIFNLYIINLIIKSPIIFILPGFVMYLGTNK